ncbi:MAG: hypothetical protein ACRC9K_20955 [Afipia sp.]
MSDEFGRSRNSSSSIGLDEQRGRSAAGGAQTIDDVFARSAIRRLYQISGRHFVQSHHRDNVMRGLVIHAARRLGPDAVPAEFAAML